MTYIEAKVTISRKTGERRYYLDGRRVSREAFEAAHQWRETDCYSSVEDEGCIRDFHYIRVPS